MLADSNSDGGGIVTAVSDPYLFGGMDENLWGSCRNGTGEIGQAKH